MNLPETAEQTPNLADPPGPPKSIGRSLRNLATIFLLLIVAYGVYAFVTRTSVTSAKAEERSAGLRIIQLDLLNGCGARGVGARMMAFLRASGFDVVEARNYRSFAVPRTLVIDRVGNLPAARRVAAALGVSEKNVIQQINPDYFVDVSVIIGQDYGTLRHSR